MVYRPINPSFGGDSFNSAHLFGLADRQNQHLEDGSSSGLSGRSSTDLFKRQIQSSLLSRVSSQIADRILGEDAQDSGQFRIDTTEISFQRIDGIISINILDGLTGETTTIDIPDPAL